MAKFRMRFLFPVSALVLLGSGTARAQPSNLTDGVFITHYPPGSVYTSFDQCAWYGQYAITSCDAQSPRIDNDAARVVWYVLAGWTGDKNFCGVEFGFGNFDPSALGFYAWGPCPPSALPIPSSDQWPSPGTGVSLAATSEPWNGNLLPVYWFDSWSYYPALLPLGSNPGTGFGGFANCLPPPVSYPAVCFGAMGMFMDGVRCCPPPPRPHVCCSWVDCEDVCFLVFDGEECYSMGGIFHPEWDTCEGSPCYTPCLPDVCCVGHECYLIIECECGLLQGSWHPEYETCGTPNPCDIYTPANFSSWGVIKALYR